MYEVEVKAKARKGTKERVMRIAKPAGVEQQKDTYFAHPCRDFARTDEALRIREAKGKLTLTYKGPKLDLKTKSRVELETPVEPEMFQILKNSGFKKFMCVSKVRRNYLTGKTTISIDNVAGLGTFMEIEQKGKNLLKAKQKVLSLFQELGYSKADSITKSYLELLLERRKH